MLSPSSCTRWWSYSPRWKATSAESSTRWASHLSSPSVSAVWAWASSADSSRPSSLAPRQKLEVVQHRIYQYISPRLIDPLAVCVCQFRTVIQTFLFSFSFLISLVVEPLAVLGMAYFSYTFAELFHFSGIIRLLNIITQISLTWKIGALFLTPCAFARRYSCIGCGLVQAHYAFANVSHKSFTTVKYFIKMLSSTSDAIIFLFLGMVLVNDVHEWHTSFVLWVLFLCLVVRFLGTTSDGN